jgi:hypothetical protein
VRREAGGSPSNLRKCGKSALALLNGGERPTLVGDHHGAIVSDEDREYAGGGSVVRFADVLQ